LLFVYYNIHSDGSTKIVGKQIYTICNTSFRSGFEIHNIRGTSKNR